MSTALAQLNTNNDIWNDESKLKEIRRMASPSAPLTDMEFSFMVELGRATQLNPFRREIWAVKYKQGIPAQIFIGRDGYVLGAQRQPDYEYHQVNSVYSNDEFYMDESGIKHKAKLIDRGVLIGAYCIVKRKSASKPTYSVVTMEEYNTNQSLWKTKPETMLKKVAEAQGVRQSFKEVFRGTYSDAELPQQENSNIRIVSGATQTEKLKNILNDNVIDAETGEVMEEPKKVHNSGNDNLPISQEQMDEINDLMALKEFSQERIKKALAYHKVELLEDLTDAQARIFLLQLEKA
jgi:phage recombination protein Bet